MTAFGGELDTIEEPEIDEPRGRLRPRMALVDLLMEAVNGMLARPSRAVLTALGTVLGVGALVSTLGLSRTAGNQIVSTFDELAATSITIEPARSSSFGQREVSNIPFDAQDRLERLNGVAAAGTLSPVDVGGQLARSVPVVDPLGTNEFDLDVVAVSPGLFPAVRASLLTGRVFDHGHSERADPVVVLGEGAAARLSVSRVSDSPAIFIGDQPYSVIGIIDDVAREPSLLNALILPDGTAARRYGLSAPASVQVEVDVGAAQVVGSQAALALAPNSPDTLQVNVPPEPRAVRAQVASDVDALFVVLGAVSLLVGAIGIANVTLVSVMERTGEIGLRRALGAGRRHVAGQFLAESSAVGFLGGLLGATAGVVVIVGVSAARDWTPVLDAWLPLSAPFVGTLVGLVAGIYPALRAAGVEPVEALRSGT